MTLVALALAHTFAFAPATGTDPVPTPGAQGTATATAPAVAAPANPPATQPARRPLVRWNQATSRLLHEGKGPSRRFMFGALAALTQSSPVRTTLLYIDPRAAGRSVAPLGGGLFFRARVRPLVGFDVQVHSGSIRYRQSGGRASLGEHHILADVGTLLYLGRGQIAQFALSGGLGGRATLLRYEVDDRKGRQSFGAFSVRLGAEAEFLLKQIAFTVSVRTYALITDRSHAHAKGALFAGRSARDREAPVTPFSTILTGSVGIAYRF